MKGPKMSTRFNPVIATLSKVVFNFCAFLIFFGGFAGLGIRVSWAFGYLGHSGILGIWRKMKIAG